VKGRLLLAALSLASSSAGAQPATRPQTAAAASDAEDPRRLAALGLTPFERHREIIRYTFTAPELSGGRAIGFRQVVVQLVPGPDGRSAALTLVTGRAPAAGAMRALSRRNETLSLEEYRILRSQLVRYASDLDISEQDVTTAVEACENGPAARFDMKLGGDSRMVLTRTGGCNGDATAYKAGDFLLVAAERILGAPIEGARPPR
jgi:hypothetical protein